MSYISVLLCLQKHIPDCVDRAKVMKVGIDFDNAISKIQKYLTSSALNYPVVFVSGSLNLLRHPSISDAFEVATGNKLCVLDEQVNIIKKILSISGILDENIFVKLSEFEVRGENINYASSFYQSAEQPQIDETTVKTESDLDKFLRRELNKEIQYQKTLQRKV